MTALKELSVKQLDRALKIRKRIDALQYQTKSLQVKLDKILGATSSPPAVKRRKKKAIKKAGRKKAVTGKIQKPAQKTAKKRGKRKQTPQKKTPVLRDVIVEVIREAKKPLNIDQILAGIRKKDVKMQSKNPKHSLGVRMYKDKAFKKAKRGYFTLRK